MLSDIKLLDRVIGEKKGLYLAILKCIANGFTEEETGNMFNLTKGRISQIVRANRQLCDELTLQSDLATKAGRLRKAFRVLHRKGDCSVKDTLDWLEYVRKEIIGEKGITLQNFIKVSNDNKSNLTDDDRNLIQTLRERLHRIYNNGQV